MAHEVCPYNFEGPATGCRPPALINTLINIALQPGALTDPMFEGQKKIQQILLLAAFVSVPIMLLCHPFYLKAKYGKKAPEIAHQVDFERLDEDEENGRIAPAPSHGGGGHGHGDEVSTILVIYFANFFN